MSTTLGSLSHFNKAYGDCLRPALRALGAYLHASPSGDVGLPIGDAIQHFASEVPKAELELAKRCAEGVTGLALADLAAIEAAISTLE